MMGNVCKKKNSTISLLFGNCYIYIGTDKALKVFSSGVRKVSMLWVVRGNCVFCLGL